MGRGPHHRHAGPYPSLQVQLQQVVVTHPVIAAIQVDVLASEYGAVCVSSVGEVGAGAGEPAPHVGGESEGEDVPISLVAAAAHDVHDVVLHHALMAVSADRCVSAGHDQVPRLGADVKPIHLCRVVGPVSAAPDVEALLVEDHGLAVASRRAVLGGVGQQHPRLGGEVVHVQVSLVGVPEVRTRPAEHVHHTTYVVSHR
mmetsp:Transcript_6167/g.14842  ORF Transcript_6167/g.14842 Transcript_6167/m.14842 type:complete len:200 (-) Transcript_6167:313-912(-)